jgi:hypothetical protein
MLFLSQYLSLVDLLQGLHKNLFALPLLVTAYIHGTKGVRKPLL